MFAMPANEVKTQLSEVLRKVESGEEILISRHGKIIARLSPWNNRKQTIANRLQAIEAVRGFKRIKLDKGETVSGLIHEGRR